MTPTDPSKPWYSLVPIGWSELNGMVNAIFIEVGITGKTNHSLQVTGATRMYTGGVGEKTIQTRTGHKSLDALRVYERPSCEQQKQACDILSGASASTATLIPVSSTSITAKEPSQPTYVFNNCVFNLSTQNFSQTQNTQNN